MKFARGSVWWDSFFSTKNNVSLSHLGVLILSFFLRSLFFFIYIFLLFH